MTSFHQMLEAEAAKEQEDPLLCAISARITVAIGRIADGRISEALSTLKQIESVLPTYHENNRLASEAAANRGRLRTRYPKDYSEYPGEALVHGGFGKLRQEKGAQDAKN